MDHVIQLIGIVMLLKPPASGKPVVAWIPEITDPTIMKHTPFIAFPDGTSVSPDHWNETGTFTSVAGEVRGKWHYYVLGPKASVTFSGDTGAAPAIPGSLPGLGGSCCKHIKLKTDPPLAASVQLPNAVSGCASDNGRIDTILHVDTAGAALVVEQKVGEQTSRLTFPSSWTIVIGNFPIDLIERACAQDPGQDKTHFRQYYTMFDKTFFWFRMCQKVPSEHPECNSSASAKACNEHAPIMAAGIQTKGFEIDCSNSHYP